MFIFLKFKNIQKIVCLNFFVILTSCNSVSIQDKKSNDIQKPNIIYILADDLGYGDVQSYNPKGKIRTPNIDAMTFNGAMFTDAHTSSAVCTPTRYGIITGRYNWRTRLKKGVLSGYSKSLIKQERTTVAELLKQQGYTTAYIGKWHLGWDWNIEDTISNKRLDNFSSKISPKVDFSTTVENGPSTHGFDYSFGFCGSLDMPPYVWVENDKPTMIPNKYTESVDDKGFWRKGLTSDDFSHTLVLQNITDKAVSYIEKASAKTNPFFLYLPLPAPHTPILPTTEFMGKSNTNMYGDFVMQVDDVVRQIRKTLKSKGIQENTLVIFTSDNGCSPKANFNELAKVGHYPSAQFRGHKADIFEGGHRVPFIVEWPNKVEKNKKIDKTICTTDFFATCADITDYSVLDNEGEDSYSILPYLFNEEILETEIRQYTIHHSFNGSFSIRHNDWKLILSSGSGGWSYPNPKDIKDSDLKLPPQQLYNLKNDIGETNNLINVFPEKAKELKTALTKIILDGRSTTGKSQYNDGMNDWPQIQSIIY